MAVDIPWNPCHIPGMRKWPWFLLGIGLAGGCAPHVMWCLFVTVCVFGGLAACCIAGMFAWVFVLMILTAMFHGAKHGIKWLWKTGDKGLDLVGYILSR